MEAWQKGFPLEELQALAEPFKTHHRKLVFGAFGLIKERDIADAKENNDIVFAGTREGDKSVVEATAVIRRLKNKSRHFGFNGADMRTGMGDIFIPAIAGHTPEAICRILDYLLKRTKTEAPGIWEPAIWIEIFEEDAIARAAMEKMQACYCLTKIAAGSEIKGLYVLRRQRVCPQPAVDYATLECLDENFLTHVDHTAIMQELEAYEPVWAQHYSSYNKRKSWMAFCLVGFDKSDPQFIIKPSEMSKAWKHQNPERMEAKPCNTAAARSFKRTLGIVNQRIPGIKDRVRFMRLSGGGELTRHADITNKEAGTQDGQFVRLHIPLRTTDAVTFMGWDARGKKIECHFKERGLYYLDQRKPHAVVNKDPALDRIHLVLDVHSNLELRQRITEAYVQSQKVA